MIYLSHIGKCCHCLCVLCNMPLHCKSNNEILTLLSSFSSHHCLTLHVFYEILT